MTLSPDTVGRAATSWANFTRQSVSPRLSSRSTAPSSLPTTTLSSSATIPAREEASVENSNTRSTGRWHPDTPVTRSTSNNGVHGQARGSMV
jgi:hypothetical protein